MSMNFGREQALLRQRLTKKGTEELIAELTAQHGESMKFLGADQREALGSPAPPPSREPST